MKKVYNFTLLLLCGGFFMLCALGSSSIDSSDYDTDRIYNIGDTLNCPSFDVTIDNVQIKGKGTAIDSWQVISDPEWIGVTVTVKNKSDETKTFYSSNIDLINSNGEEFMVNI